MNIIVRNDPIRLAMRSIRHAAEAHATTFHVEHDFEQRARLVAAAPDWPDKTAPTYDPRYNTLTPENAFWLAGRAEGYDGIVCSCSVRVWRQVQLHDLFVNSRFLQDGTRADSGHRIEFRTREARDVYGNMAYIGSGWVHPDFRKQRLAALALAYTQAVLLRDYDLDYALGLIHHKSAEQGLGARSYHFRHHHRGVIWLWPGRGELDAWLLYNNREEIMDELQMAAAA